MRFRRRCPFKDHAVRATRLFRHEHCNGPRRGVPREVFAFDGDRISATGAVLGSLRPQVHRQASVWVDEPIRFLIAVTRSVDRLIAGDRNDLAGRRAVVVSGADTHRDRDHLMVRWLQHRGCRSRGRDDRFLGVNDQRRCRGRGLVAFVAQPAPTCRPRSSIAFVRRPA